MPINDQEFAIWLDSRAKETSGDELQKDLGEIIKINFSLL